MAELKTLPLEPCDTDSLAQHERYKKMLFEVRDVLNCGHIDNIPAAINRMNAQLQDAIGLRCGLQAAIVGAKELIGDGEAATAWRAEFDLWLKCGAA